MAVPTLELSWIDPGDGSHEDNDSVGLHEENSATFQYAVLPSAVNRIPDLVETTGFNRSGNALYLPVESGGGVVTGTIGLNPARLRWGAFFASRSAHRCWAAYEDPYCIGCGHYMPVDLRLFLSQDVLTLKHDGQTAISIVHADPRGSVLSDPSIQIRRLGETNWIELADSDSVDPWTARVAGYFELQGRISVDGREAFTPVENMEVRFPSYDQIWNDPAFIGLANVTWTNILNDCSPSNRRERGFWVRLNTSTESYFRDQEIPGPLVTNGAVAYVELGPRPGDLPSSPAPLDGGVIYTVASFHGHTPTTYAPRFRLVGPTDGDALADAAAHIPGIVFDYVECLEGCGYIPRGWPKNGACQFYKTPGLIRRPTPSP